MESATTENESQIVGQFTTAAAEAQTELQEFNPSPPPFPFSQFEAPESSLLMIQQALSHDNDSLHVPLPVQPPPPPPPPPRGLHPAIRRIQKDGIAGIFLTYQLPATVVASLFSLISGNSERYESTTTVMLGLLSLVVVALIAGNVLRDERPVVAAAAELVGISLGLVAFVYPMSVLLGGPILCYLPPICGVAVAVMYAYRLATASSHNE